MVSGYATVLAVMAVCGIETGHIVTAVGASLFLVSDPLIGRTRFVGRPPHADLLIIVSCHVGQALILIGLLR